MKKKFKIPWLPTSALIFYLTAFVLWTLSIIPPPTDIFLFLESLYQNYGLTGLFIASLLEGIVYFGLYFPGSFIVAIAVFLSDGTFKSLILISIVVAIALTITSSINYLLGKYIITKRGEREEILEEYKEHKVISKGFFLSIIHPNSLAFYFFNSGIKKQNYLRILFVPIVMIPYGFLLANILYLFREPLRTAVESPFIMITFISIWLILAFILNRK